MGEVGYVDLVDETIDTLLERFPRDTLVLLTRLVRNLGLHHPQTGRRDVGATWATTQQLTHI